MEITKALEARCLSKLKHMERAPHNCRLVDVTQPTPLKKPRDFWSFCRQYCIPLVLLFALSHFARAEADVLAKKNTTLNSSAVLHVRGDFNYPPFEYLSEQNQAEGFNVDVMNAVAKAMGIKVEINLGPWEEVVPQLKKGEIDALLGIFKTVERDTNHRYDGQCLCRG